MDNFNCNTVYGFDTRMRTPIFQPQLDFDPAILRTLGFNQVEIDTLKFIILNSGKVTLNVLMQNGLTYAQASRLKYMYNICLGKVQIESIEDLSKHLRKMFGSSRRIGISDLAVSKVSKVPRKAVVGGIKDPTFSMYNSCNYEVYDRMYDVVDTTGARIIVETSKKPVLKYKQSKSVEGVAEIKELESNGKVKIAFNKKYCKLCNRFIIVASLRRPEFHHGMIELLAFEGTKIYVYARTLGTKETVGYTMGTQRVYDYGFYTTEINEKLQKVAQELFVQLCAVWAGVTSANQDYRILSLEQEEDEDNIDIEE